MFTINISGYLQPADPVQPDCGPGLHPGGHRQRGARLLAADRRHLPLLRLANCRGGCLVRSAAVDQKYLFRIGKISTSGSCCCRSRRLTRTRSRTWTTHMTRCSPPSRPTTRSASSSGRSGGCWSPSRREASSRCSSVLLNIFPT